MEQNIQINQNFTITRDGEVTDEYEPSALQQARRYALDYISGVIERLALEGRLIAFDLRHRTNYRAIRRALVEQRKRERFEHSIGLMRA